MEVKMKCITCNDFKKCNSIDGWPLYVGCFYVISSGNNLNRTSYLYRGGEKYFLTMNQYNRMIRKQKLEKINESW
jgi:hypothetical protein